MIKPTKKASFKTSLNEDSCSHIASEINAEKILSFSEEECEILAREECINCGKVMNNMIIHFKGGEME